MNKVIFDLTIVFIPSQFLMHVEKGHKPCISAAGGIFHYSAGKRKAPRSSNEELRDAGRT